MGRGFNYITSENLTQLINHLRGNQLLSTPVAPLKLFRKPGQI